MGIKPLKPFSTLIHGDRYPYPSLWVRVLVGVGVGKKNIPMGYLGHTLHVKGDKNGNPLILFLSKKTMFSLFPFFQAVEVAVMLKFQIRVGASNWHILARVYSHVFMCSLWYSTVNSKQIVLCTTPQINRFVHQICNDCSPPFPDRLSCLVC